jgi:hypothetical protein
MRHLLPLRTVGGLVVTPILVTVFAGCGGAAGGQSSDQPAGYLSGEGPGWYDGVRYLNFTESDGRLTGFLSAVVPDVEGEGVVRVQYTLDGFADGDTLTLTATADPGNADTYLGGSGTWLGRQEGEALLLTFPEFGIEDEFRPTTEEAFNKAAAQASTVAIQQRNVWAANDTTAGTVEEVHILGERLAAMTYTDLLAEYDTNLADIREAVASLWSTGDCHYAWVVEYELDAIADLDSRRLEADLANVALDATALDAAQARARAAHDELQQAIAALPEGVDTSPRATVSAEALERAFTTADDERLRAQTAVAAAEEQAAGVRSEAHGLAAEVSAAGC